MVDSFIPSVTPVTTSSQQPFYTECTSATVGAGSDFSLVQTGAGMTVTQVSGTNNSSYYEIAAGTTANSETILLSKYAFQYPATIDVCLDRSTSSGVANNSTSFEIVEVDPTLIISSPSTAVVTSGTDAQFANARSGYQLFFPSGSTTATYYFRSSGKSSLSLNNSSLSIVASRGTSPNFTPGVAVTFTVDHTGITKFWRSTSTTYPFVQENSAASGATDDGSSVPSTFLSLDPTKWYALRLRVTNGGTSPASSISTRLYRAIVRPYQLNPVDVLTSPQIKYGNTSSSYSQKAVPVQVITAGNAIPISISTNLTLAQASAVQMASVNSANTNTTTLGSSATYTGTATSGTPQGWILWTVTADQPSATNGLQIQISNSTATNWITVAQDTLTTTSGVLATKQLAFAVPLTITTVYGYNVRVVYTNGATAQGVFTSTWSGGLFSKPT